MVTYHLVHIGNLSLPKSNKNPRLYKLNTPVQCTGEITDISTSISLPVVMDKIKTPLHHICIKTVITH